MRTLTLILFSLPLVISTWCFAQVPQLSLTEAYTSAQAHYPLVNQAEILEEISAITLSQIRRSRLPDIQAVAEGILQSDNVQIGGIPGVPLNIEAPLESFRAYLDVQVLAFDGGVSASQRRIEQARERVNQEALNVDLRTLKDRVNVLFFTITANKKQVQIIEASIDNLDKTLESVQARFDQGVVLESELNKLNVRKLELESDLDQLEGDIKAPVSVLAKLTGLEVSPETRLIFPKADTGEDAIPITRPEQSFFVAQQMLYQSQKRLARVRRLPTIGIFGQGGVGYPNPLNFNEIETSLYGLIGVRLNWKILDWGKSRQDRQILNLEMRNTELDKLTFEFNVLSRQKEFKERINALDKTIANNEKIVALQTRILNQSEIQLQNGVLTANDYVQQVNAELIARLRLELLVQQRLNQNIEYLTLFGQL
ncbi:MAG: TolC family protein [Bacteroidota bacterium]